MKYEDTLLEVLVNREQIEKHCNRLRKEVESDYQNLDKPLICLGLLKGCHPFMSDLLKDINVKHVCDYMDISSYFGNEKAVSEVKIIKDMSMSVENRDVLIIEDIVDSGRTIKKVIEMLEFRGAKTVKVVTMCDKPAGRTVELNADYIGEIVPDAFLVGYGLDYKEEYRNMCSIGILNPKFIVKE